MRCINNQPRIVARLIVSHVDSMHPLRCLILHILFHVREVLIYCILVCCEIFCMVGM